MEESVQNNPFTSEYVEQEVRWFNTEEYVFDGILIKMVSSPEGPFENLFQSVVWKEGEFNFPILMIDGKLWMSLAPLELQAMWVPIQLAHGDVGLGGLGLGYTALRMAKKDSVSKITVFEGNKRIIDTFNKLHSNRNGFDKIEVVYGDLLDTCKEYTFDFFFNDIYEELLQYEAITDTLVIKENNFIKMYRVFGQEVAMLTALASGTGIVMTEFDKQLINYWYESGSMDKRLERMSEKDSTRLLASLNLI